MSMLSSFQSEWEKAVPSTASEFHIPDDGTYNASVEDFLYTEESKTGAPTPTFIYTLRIFDGGNEGMTFKKYVYIRTPKNLQFFKGELNAIGANIPRDLEDTVNAVKCVIGAVVEVTIKTRSYQGKEYKDIFINRLIKKGAGVKANADPFAAQPDEDIDVPF